MRSRLVHRFPAFWHTRGDPALRRRLSARGEEGKFASDHQSEQLHKLRTEMQDRQGVQLSEVREAAEARRLGSEATAVDLSPSIAAAMAWAKARRAPPPSQAQVH